MTLEVIVKNNLQIKYGPSISFNHNIDTANGYNVVTETIEKGKNAEIDTNCGGKEKLDMFSLSSTHYDPGIEYEIKDGDKGTLSRGQLLVGNDMVKLLKKAPEKIKITNNSDHDITVQALIVRRAT